MRSICIAMLVTAVAFAALPAGATFELRTWATPAAAPATGAPVCTSTNFVMRARLGGPFAGHAESTSFALWGYSAYTPVEIAFFAALTEPQCVTLRWSAESLSGIQGFNVRRACEFVGPFERINEEVIPASSPGSYEDRTVWPGSQFWYELWAVYGDGSEERMTVEPVSVATGGTLETRLYPLSPNPFTDAVSIQFDVASSDGPVVLEVYDLAGRAVATLEPVVPRPGRYVAMWDGRNDGGEQVASGVYFCRLEAQGRSHMQRVVVLR